MKEFIKKMLSGGEDVSSKRVCGLIGWAVSILLVITVTFFKADITANQLSLVTTLMYSSAAVLGISVVNQMKKKSDGDSR
jgi:hypothetical protein